MRKLLITLALLASTSIPAFAGHSDPSFNCNYAKLPAEMAICNDEGLGDLDRTNASLFYALSNKAKKFKVQSAFNKHEREWLQERNDCGYDANCLRNQYGTHLEYLCKLVDKWGLTSEEVNLEDCDLEGGE